MPLYHLDQYWYELPPQQIAHYPVGVREHARLMVIDRASGAIRHERIEALPDYFSADDALIVNTSKVRKARFLGQRKSGGRIECLLIENLGNCTWRVFLKMHARTKLGMQFTLGACEAEVIAVEDRTACIRLNKDPDGGLLPLPPYMKRDASHLDDERYQTVYANQEGSIAAPTAGLHLSQAMLETLRQRGVQLHEVALHVGRGTFQSVTTNDIRDHTMHHEFYEVGCAQDLLGAHQTKRITCVGTTSVRVLESAWQGDSFASGLQTTDLFMYPGKSFMVTDRLLTNFHIPSSTLLMLVSAFGGYELMKDAYKEAVRLGYRFLSYGDGMLIV